MLRWVVIALLGIVGGFMVFDGARALVVGEYLTPRTGEYAAQLGPWTKPVEAVGIDPRSTSMKVGFILLGVIHLSGAAVLVFEVDGAAAYLPLVAATMGLWYLTVGAILDGLAVAIILSSSLRPWS